MLFFFRAVFLAKFKPLAIETIDDKIQRYTQELPEWPKLQSVLDNSSGNNISSIVEFVAYEENELKQ